MIEELLVYQKADAKLRKIEKELMESDERKKAITAKKYLDTVEENVNKLDVKAAELVNQYEKAEEELKKLQEQQAEFLKATESTQDETGANFILKKIDELLGQMKALAQKTQKIAEEINGVVKEYSTIKANTKVAQAQYSENGKKYNELKNSKQAEKDAIIKELDELKKKVDSELMEKYLQKRNNKIYPVFFEVKGDVCGACNMQLSMNDLNRLKNGEIIECDQCGRYLYQGK